MIKEETPPSGAEPIERPALDPTRLSLSEQRYLAGPLVQPRLNGWDFPDRLRDVVPAARVLQLLRGQADALERDLASEEEALGYLSCASLDAPFDRDWAEIMGYLAQQVFPRWRFTEEEVHAVLGYARPIALNPMQAEDLRRFRRWLQAHDRKRRESEGRRQEQTNSNDTNHEVRSTSTEENKMDIGLLFRKRHALTDEGLPWLRGDERGPWCAHRNLTREAGVSAILIRAVQAAAQHHAICEARFAAKDGRPIIIVSSTSKSTGKVIESYLVSGDAASSWAAYLPNGNADRVTYYLGLLVLAEAMAAPSAYLDLLDAYEELITATKGGAILETHKDLLCRTADEVYYGLRYQDLPVDAAHDRLSDLQVHDLAAFTASGVSGGVTPFSPQVFYDTAQLRAYRSGTSAPTTTPTARSPKTRSRPVARAAPSPERPRSFCRAAGAVDLRRPAARQDGAAGRADGHGQDARGRRSGAADAGRTARRIEGKEGLLDVDFLGNIVPREDQRVWQDGPLAEAIQAAQCDPVVLFIDEVDTIPS